MSSPSAELDTGSVGHPQVFVEDRDDVVRRAMPRLAVGTFVILTVLMLVVTWLTPDARPTVTQFLAIDVGVTALALLLRGDVWCLRFGRRVRYEIDEQELRAFRGSKLVAAFQLGSVGDWSAAQPVETWVYWVGWGVFRNFALPLPLTRYRFKVREADSKRAKWVRPPALFRWSDRGGLEDVTSALTARLGKPINGV